MFNSRGVFDFFFQEIHFTQQPKTGLISRFYRQVENRLKKIVARVYSFFAVFALKVLKVFLLFRISSHQPWCSCCFFIWLTAIDLDFGRLWQQKNKLLVYYFFLPLPLTACLSFEASSKWVFDYTYVTRCSMKILFIVLIFFSSSTR